MKTSKKIQISENHQIEIGISTWDTTQQSIRNRYNLSNGRIDPRSSSEIPRNDLRRLFIESIRNNLLEPLEQIEILEELIIKIKQSFVE